MAFPGLILIRPAHPGNIGACQRLAANFCLPSVAVVDPVYGALPPAQFWEQCAHWAWRTGIPAGKPGVFGSLEEASRDHVLLIGTAPPGRSQANVVSIEEAAAWLHRDAHKGPAAWVLGGERNGLGPEEWCRVRAAVEIPTASGQPDMNLSHAAAILAWESRRAAFAVHTESVPDTGIATSQEVEQVYTKLGKILAGVDYLLPNGTKVLRELRAFLTRAAPTRRELDLLIGMAGAIASSRARKAGSGTDAQTALRDQDEG